MLQRRFKRVIQIELNEISDHIVDALVSRGLLPTFSELKSENWFHYRTTSETEYHLIEPWIQWVSAHTGKTFAEHGIFHLGGQSALKFPQTWEILEQKAGVRSCIVSALNSNRGTLSSGVFIPDPWATKDETLPRELAPLWRLLSKKIKGHATAGKISIAELLSGLGVCVKLKIPLTTYFTLGVTTLSTAISRSKRWLLAASLDTLLCEVFIATMRRSKAQYGVLFLNSVAHFQHHYWRNFDKTGFSSEIVSPDCGPNDDPVTYGYQVLDKSLAKLLSEFNDGETLFIVASGLSQAPYQEHELEGGMNYYRLSDHLAFCDRLFSKTVDVGNLKISALMSRDWRIESADHVLLKKFALLIADLTVDGNPLFKIDCERPGELTVETAVTCSLASTAEIKVTSGDSRGLFFDYFTNTAVKSGHHTGVGTIWFSQSLKDLAFQDLALNSEFPLTALHALVINNFCAGDILCAE